MIVVLISFGKELYGPYITGILTAIAAYAGTEKKFLVNRARWSNEAHTMVDRCTPQDRVL
jgi:hypothetical protein